MTPPVPNAAQIELVRESFVKVVSIAEQAAQLFYDRLFEIAPEVRPMFKGDIASQGRKLMTTLAVVVGSLEDLASIMPSVESLAVKHVSYGVKAAHYEQVGAALLWTLEKGLGPDFTSETKAAWAQTYGALSDAMIAAAYGGQSAA
jgi:hemoglobin-like flavoprotein